MKVFSHLWQYLSKFFKWDIFQTKIVPTLKTHILCSITFSRKSCRLWDNFEKFGGTRGATNDDKIWYLNGACWISKATRAHAHAHAHEAGQTHTRTQECERTHKQTNVLNLLLFHGNNDSRTHCCIYEGCLDPVLSLGILFVDESVNHVKHEKPFSWKRRKTWQLSARVSWYNCDWWTFIRWLAYLWQKHEN